MKTFWKALFCISLAVLIVCIGILGYDFYQTQSGKNIGSDYTKPTNTTQENLAENPIDFKKLQKTNSDIYSWIKIDGTNIDYPILNPNGKSNDYYLRKNIKGEYDSQGVIFTENYNSTDWSDRVTPVYGHNIWTKGTMFYELRNFREEKFFKKHREIVIYAPQRKLTYEIYSAFEYDDRHIMNSFDFEDDKSFNLFVGETLNPVSLSKNIIQNESIGTNDKLIVLSTCIKDKENSRYLVVGKLIKDEKTK